MLIFVPIKNTIFEINSYIISYFILTEWSENYFWNNLILGWTCREFNDYIEIGMDTTFPNLDI
jgi:hypothetical protein